MLEELEQSQPTQETTPAQETPKAPEAPVQKPHEEYILRRMVEERDEARRLAEDQARRLKELEERFAAPQQPTANDDDYVEQRHLKLQQQEVQKTRKELEETRKEMDQLRQNTIEFQLRSKYSDIEQIVNQENLKRLSELKPALYRSTMANPDLRDKLESAYELIKNYVQPGKFAAQDQRIQENQEKPRSAATVSPQASESPLARAGDFDRRILTPQRKAELYRQMREAQGYTTDEGPQQGW